jgi:hypothetical protein
MKVFSIPILSAPTDQEKRIANNVPEVEGSATGDFAG